MVKIEKFTFNDFGENTYILYEEGGDCWIIDPGCSVDIECKRLEAYVEKNKLKVKAIVHTHCHIDHVLGNHWVKAKYNAPIFAHKNEKIILESCEMVAKIYEMNYVSSPPIDNFIDENSVLQLGKYVFKIFFTPGHSPGSLSYYQPESKWLISGDVLFLNSIGRTDFPLCNHQDLVDSIKEKLYSLPDETVVYPGHGGTTTIGYEKKNNPFVRL